MGTSLLFSQSSCLSLSWYFVSLIQEKYLIFLLLVDYYKLVLLIILMGYFLYGLILIILQGMGWNAVTL